MRHRKAIGSTRGFTLVELLVAVAVGTVLVTAATLVLAAGMRTFAWTSGSGEAELREVRLASALVRDLSSAMPLNGEKFAGDATTMSFPRLVSSTRTTNDVGIARVQWTHDPRRGWVRTLTRPDGVVEQERFGRMRNVRLTYAGRGDAVQASPPVAVEWREKWTQRRFPGVVRIEAHGFELEVARACSPYTLADGKEAE